MVFLAFNDWVQDTSQDLKHNDQITPSKLGQKVSRVGCDAIGFPSKCLLDGYVRRALGTT